MRRIMVMPASPALLPELSPADAPSRALLGAAVECARCAAAEGITRVDIVGSRDKRWYTRHTGSFRAWGAPSLSVGDGSFLPELLARYVLAHSPTVQIERSRDTLGHPREGVLTVVVVDGSAGLSARAPLALIDGAWQSHLWCEAVLSGSDCAPYSRQRLSAAGVDDPALWGELAALHPISAELLATDVTLGVGRYVADWQL